MSKTRDVLDVMRVPASGDPLRAVVSVDLAAPVRDVECDILVVGAGLGGVAAAWATARRGRTVCLLEETDWLGGQITSQGVSALDEHAH
jgi:NADPH-dependent 2,4-dienoyl-CoA reductase/sulfur reductase-like enzyme